MRDERVEEGDCELLGRVQSLVRAFALLDELATQHGLETSTSF